MLLQNKNKKSNNIKEYNNNSALIKNKKKFLV